MLKRFAIPAVFVLSFSVAWSQQAPAGDDACAKLASLTLPGAKVVSAAVVAAGAFVPSGRLDAAAGAEGAAGGAAAVLPRAGDGHAEHRLCYSD